MKYCTVIDPLNLTKCRLQPAWGIGYSEQQVCHLALLLCSNFMSNYVPFCWTQHMGKDAAVYELHEIDFKLELLSSITFYHYIIFNISDNTHEYVGIKYFIALVGKCSHSSNEQQYKEKKGWYTLKQYRKLLSCHPPFISFSRLSTKLSKIKEPLTNKILFFFQSVSKQL